MTGESGPAGGEDHPAIIIFVLQVWCPALSWFIVLFNYSYMMLYGGFQNGGTPKSSMASDGCSMASDLQVGPAMAW